MPRYLIGAFFKKNLLTPSAICLIINPSKQTTQRSIMAKLVIKKVSTGHYRTTREDGQVIKFEKREGYWLTSYEGDFNGDNNHQADTKAELVKEEQRIADMI